MKFNIPKDQFENFIPPRLFLCTTGGKRIGELPAYEIKLVAKWNSYSELSFSIDRQYVDILTGETAINPLFDKAEGLRQVEAENVGMFIIQDPDTEYGDKDSKSISAFSIEYSCGSKYLENFYVNNGADESIEVTYESSKYGPNATKDDMYKLARESEYDSSEKYFYRNYTDSTHYTYEQIQIANETVYKTHFGPDIAAGDILYIHGYANVTFYNRNTPELSLLHNIFEKIPEWRIGNVDYALWNKERKIEEDRISVYDLLTNKVTDLFECVVIWNTLSRTVDFRVEENDGLTENGVVNTDWETDVYISRENLANQIQVKYSTDDIKTKLKVSGSDDLTIREVNLGKNYIMNLDFYHNLEWMEQDVYEAYDNYLDAVEESKQPYEDAVQGWVSAYNQWDELMNAVPAEGNVVLVGDLFKKLYCIYTPINNAYSTITFTDSSISSTVTDLYSDSGCTQTIDKTSLSNGDTFIVQGYKLLYQQSAQNFICDSNEMLNNLPALRDKLKLYHVDEDISGNKTDNILLSLKNTDSDTATIRIYDPHISVANSSAYNSSLQYYYRTGEQESTYKYHALNIKNANEYSNAKQTYGQLYTNNYKIESVITRASSGIKDTPSEYTLSSWIQGHLTTDNNGIDGMSNLKDFKIASIGTMGAYLVLAKDEKQEANLNEYGVELLRTKRDTYTKIFQTQTEAMWSQEKYQCIASKSEPTGNVPEGTRWFKTDDVILYKRTDQPSSASFEQRWEVIIADGNAADYENYQRYIDNYEKLQTVQTVLNKKERKAQYYLDGYEISDRKIDVTTYPSSGQSLEADMERAARAHFKDYTVARVSFDNTFPLYTFTTSYEPGTNFAVYLQGTTPYVAYAASRGVYQMKMNYYSNLTEMNNFFTEDQWIRLSPFIREDEYSNDNLLLNGLESEEDRIKIYKELVGLASKELKKLSQPSLEFSMDMANLLAIPEFEPLMLQFALGNFIRIELRPELIKRARLLEVSLNFDNLSDFSCTFGNLVTTQDEIDKHADLLKQAVQAGRQVANSADDWQKAVEKSNKLEQDIANGLQDSVIAIGNASGQAISWDATGMHFRKYKDGSDTEYEPEEMAIINNSLVATNDSWRTSKAAFGKYTIDGETRWGPIAEYVTADTLEGKLIKGGSIEIGADDTKFIVNEDGSVEIRSDGKSVSAADMSMIKNALEFSTQLEYSGQTVLSDQSHQCEITCKIYHLNKNTGVTEDITSLIMSQSGSIFTWSGFDISHPPQIVAKNKIIVNHTNVSQYSEITCQVQFDDSQWITNS